MRRRQTHASVSMKIAASQSWNVRFVECVSLAISFAWHHRQLYFVVVGTGFLPFVVPCNSGSMTREGDVLKIYETYINFRTDFRTNTH
eukprot:509855-Amphidinium_carterae.1